MKSSEWIDLLKQIPFHEVEARRIIGDRVMQAQCRQLIRLLKRPTAPSTTDSAAPRG